MKSKFNIIDLIIIIAVVLVIAFGAFAYYSYINNDSNAEVTDTTKLNFVIEVNNVNENIANSYKKGDAISFGSLGSGKGVITNVEVVPYRVWSENSEVGEVIINEVPDKYIAKITIEADVIKTDKSYTCNNERIVIGKLMPFAVKGASADCYVVDLYEI